LIEVRVVVIPRLLVECVRRRRTLVCMRCAVLGDRPRVLESSSDDGRGGRSLRDACAVVGGDFTLLWHNRELCRAGDRRLYAALLARGMPPMAEVGAPGRRSERCW
jgi:hypothetical protein